MKIPDLSSSDLNYIFYSSYSFKAYLDLISSVAYVGDLALMELTEF